MKKIISLFVLIFSFAAVANAQKYKSRTECLLHVANLMCSSSPESKDSLVKALGYFGKMNFSKLETAPFIKGKSKPFEYIGTYEIEKDVDLAYESMEPPLTISIFKDGEQFYYDLYLAPHSIYEYEAYAKVLHLYEPQSKFSFDDFSLKKAFPKLRPSFPEQPKDTKYYFTTLTDPKGEKEITIRLSMFNEMGSGYNTINTIRLTNKALE